MQLSTTKEYQNLIEIIKRQISSSRQKAIKAVNFELISMYHQIGKHIFEEQEKNSWWDNIIWQIEKDLKLSFPNITWFSRTNLFYMKKFYLFFGKNIIVPPVVGQIPWTHIRIILDKVESIDEANFYISKTIENWWTKIILAHQIDSKLFERKANLSNNFAETIEENSLAIIQDSFKERYILDFLDLGEQAKEKDLEEALIQNITKFLVELWKWFAFVWKQYKLTIDNKEFFIDLLFYHYILKRFVVIELKTTEFKPEHIWQLGFYMNVVDKQVRTEEDKETIWLVICKTKNKTIVEYALTNVNQPMWVAEYEFKQLPKEFSKYLPDSEDLGRYI